MKIIINKTDFLKLIEVYGYLDDLGGFRGWEALFDYLNEFEGTLHFDPVALGCDFDFYETKEELLES